MVGFATRVSVGSRYGACLLSGSAYVYSVCGGWNFDGKARSESVLRDFGSALVDRAKQNKDTALASHAE